MAEGPEQWEKVQSSQENIVIYFLFKPGSLEFALLL